MEQVNFFNKIYVKVLGIILSIILIYSTVINFFLAPRMQQKMMSLELRNAKAELEKVALLVKYTSDEFKEFQKFSLKNRKENLIFTTNFALQTIKQFYEKYKTGEITEKHAKQEIIYIIASFGKNKNNYFLFLIIIIELFITQLQNS